MSDDLKRCPRCEKFLATGDFHRDKARPDGLQLWCKVCCRERDRARPRQRKTVRRVLRVRANNRALAALKRAHPGEFDALYDEALAAVIEQHESFLANATLQPDLHGPDAQSPDPQTAGWVRPEPAPGRYPGEDAPTDEQPDDRDDLIPLLRSGPPVPGEPIETRLLPATGPGCTVCKSRHDRDHRCPICGSKPQVMVPVGNARVIRSTA